MPRQCSPPVACPPAPPLFAKDMLLKHINLEKMNWTRLFANWIPDEPVFPSVKVQRQRTEVKMQSLFQRQVTGRKAMSGFPCLLPSLSEVRGQRSCPTLSLSSWWTFYSSCSLQREHKGGFVWALSADIYSWKKLLLVKFVEMYFQRFRVTAPGLLMLNRLASYFLGGDFSFLFFDGFGSFGFADATGGKSKVM